MIQILHEDTVRQLANGEEGECVTAGSNDIDAFYRRVERHRLMNMRAEYAISSVFGRFLNLARRERSLSIEQLANDIDADVIELFLVEEGKKIPPPQLVSKLALALNVPAKRMLQLAGHVDVIDKDVITAAYQFAARADSRPLEPNETEALHEFVKALAS